MVAKPKVVVIRVIRAKKAFNFKVEGFLSNLKKNLALNYFSEGLPPKYLRRCNVSLSSSGWSRSGSIAPVAPGNALAVLS